MKTLTWDVGKRGGFAAFLFFAAVFLFSGTGVAQASGQSDDYKTIAGTTPDSLFYGLDVAFDSLSLALQSDDKSRAEKGLEIARERLAEVKVMIDEKKLDDAEEAEAEYEDSLQSVNNAVSELSRDNSTEEIRDVIEIKKELKARESDLGRVKTEVNLKIKAEGGLTEQQRAQINAILGSLANQTGHTEIEIEIKENNTKIKIKQETGKSDDEIDDELKDIEDEIGLEDIEVKAEIIGNRTEVKIENDFVANTTDRSALIGEIMRRFALDNATVDKLLKVESEDDEGSQEKSRLEIKAETRDGGVTEVEAELKFTLNATDRASIVNGIVSETLLSKESVENALLGESEEEPHLSGEGAHNASSLNAAEGDDNHLSNETNENGHDSQDKEGAHGK